MGTIEIIQLVAKGVAQLYTMAAKAGYVNQDPAAYITAAADYVQRGTEIIMGKLTGSTDYDALTPEEIEKLLQPVSLEEIETEAKKRFEDRQ
jgi:hypothetical protein